jgi:phenylalanyl-tRNA synthetase alpha chain
VDSITDQTQIDVRTIEKEETHPDAQLIKNLKKRNLITTHKTTSYRVTKGPEFSTTVKKEETDVTAEMITSGEWKKLQFKKYNFEAQGSLPEGGHLHPLLKVRDEFRQIFFELGFSEMPSGKYVESSFWNFDALFQPQQHPARDAHDTFFLKEPAVCHDLPKDYVERVRKVHSEGGYGSLGYCPLT